jgi:hypothetical protein
MGAARFSASAEVCKVDRGLGLVFGWAIVCKIDGVDYFDRQGDHIPEHSMLEAATEFMLSERTAKVMHEGGTQGKVAFAWPMTAEVAKAFGVETGKTGLMIAVKAEPTMLAKFDSGELKGFSIGGSRDPEGDVEVPE